MTALDGRIDYDVIAGWVSPGARVLDLGCGDGALLRHLKDSRGASGYGVEIDIERVISCMRNGINVLQIDLRRACTTSSTRASTWSSFRTRCRPCTAPKSC